MKEDSNVGRPEKYSADELCRRALELQYEFPLKTEGAICGRLGVGRQYIADRAKRNPTIAETREVMAAIRQDAWEELLAKIITTPSSLCTPNAFIWGSRNVLGWRNGEALVEVSKANPASADGDAASNPMTPADYLSVLKAREKPGDSK